MNPRKKTKMATLTGTLGVLCLLVFHTGFTFAQDTYKIQKANVDLAEGKIHDGDMLLKSLIEEGDN